MLLGRRQQCPGRDNGIDGTVIAGKRDRLDVAEADVGLERAELGGLEHPGRFAPCRLLCDLPGEFSLPIRILEPLQ